MNPSPLPKSKHTVGQKKRAGDGINVFDEDGALSRAFLLARGFCCTNGCKNCPYGFDRFKESEELT